MRLSYSQANTFKQCPTHWYNKYKLKYESPEQGASLYFGSAVDDAVMALLEGKSNYLDIFQSRWKTAKGLYGNVTPIFDNPEVVFGYADFDKHLIGEAEEELLCSWLVELQITRQQVTELRENSDGKLEEVTRLETPTEIYQNIASRKKNPHKIINKRELQYFNRASWLSLDRKGSILIESFKDQFLPRITKVLGTQLKGDIKSDDGKDSITGLLDFVVELEGFDKPIIIDLKTAAQPYKQEQIDLTEQLALYYAMKGEEYGTDLVGYVVLCKNIPKVTEAYCKKCGHKKEGRHKTCDNEIEGVRCGGEWQEKTKLDPQVQVLIQKKTEDDKYRLFADYSNIMQAMKNDIIYKNTDKCNNFYGSRCPYYDLCFKGTDAGLKKRS
jgi:hypothetical protein